MDMAGFDVVMVVLDFAFMFPDMPVGTLPWISSLKSERLRRLVVLVDNCDPLSMARRGMDEARVKQMVMMHLQDQSLGPHPLDIQVTTLPRDLCCHNTLNRTE